MADELGLKANIARREFLQGGLVAAAGTGLSAHARAGAVADYPPAKVGMRGAHAGSFESAHALVAGQVDLTAADEDNSTYDLVVVGAGVSGLSAAYFYRKQHPDARILILDNHDDFGGHAKRNEFRVNGKHLIGYGGSQSIESPGAYSEVARGLLNELAVDLDQFYQFFDQDFYRRHGLGSGVFFDKSTYGADQYVPASFLLNSSLLGFAEHNAEVAAVIAQMPLDAQAKAELLNLVTDTEDCLPDVGLLELPAYLSGKSYEAFLLEDVGIKSPQVIALLRRLPTGYFGLGTDAIPALEALTFGLPGINKTGILAGEPLRDLGSKLVEPYIFHFPDGNASIARLLVRSLIPKMNPITDPTQLVGIPFNYALLDAAENNVKIRLNSTAVQVANRGDGVEVHYQKGAQVTQVRAKHAVLACYNAMIPYLCPELPAQQKAALREAVKVPLTYTNVVLNQWHALKKQAVGFAYTPSSFHSYFMVDFPVSLGRYQFAQSPDEPIALHFSEALIEPGLTAKQQHRAGRARLLATPFAEIERDVRETLAGVLGPGGFDPGRDIAAITVNRWPHGYAYSHNALFDPAYDEGQAPHEIGRQTYKQIAIANSDAGAQAYLDTAIDQAHRAVGELT